MSGNKPTQSALTSEVFKKLMLEKSKTFCMYPWIHLHTTPASVAAPCCISASCATHTGVGDPRELSLMDLVNSKQMSQLRLDMLTGTPNKECTGCYKHEEQGITSARQFANKEFAHSFDEVMPYTDVLTGELSEFQMRYFDIRFSNICNFKCRTCGSGFSSQWEHEDLKSGVHYAREIPKNNSKAFLQDVIDQVDYMEVAYFAGGEPLITEEHYILLEEMIRRKRTNIKLRYNTNLSNFKFKNKDLLGLWKNFEHNIQIYASVDHYGKRAEYIRHGTDWGVVESNFLAAREKPFIDLQINTVLSVFNYLTIYEFYEYLIQKKMYTARSNVYSLYAMSTPDFLTCHILPENLKMRGKESVDKTIALMKSYAFSPAKVEQLQKTTQWVFSKNTFEHHKEKFRNEVARLDAIRGENFIEVFPELESLMREPRPRRGKMLPV
jgi:hypothetical protein